MYLCVYKHFYKNHINDFAEFRHVKKFNVYLYKHFEIAKITMKCKDCFAFITNIYFINDIISRI